MWQSIVQFIGNGIEFFGQAAGNYGLGIIIFTILVRLLMVPLTYSQSRTTVKMQRINPELDELKKKHKDDPQKMNEETVKLWKKHGVNPASGCLPLLIQFPIIIAMFTALRQFEFAADSGFLWMGHLAQPDPLYILPILAGIATFVQTKMSSAQAGPANNAVMLYGMPIFIIYISTQFPAGLALYWTVTNIFGVGQQYVVNQLLSLESQREGESA